MNTQHPLITKTIELAKEKNILIDNTEFNNIHVETIHSNYFDFHSYYVSIRDNKLAIIHHSNNYGETVYTSNGYRVDFTPESALEAIQKTIAAMNEAEKILNKAPLSNTI